jgi:glycosyltransferase involved in cell wall biosynthesis
MSPLLISVALCTYNASRYLQQELQSIAAQTKLPDEVVVCDDGSLDDTLAILERFRRTVCFPVRIFRNETNLGRTKNFEKAIGLCGGDLIALADFDDVWYPKKLQVLCAALETDSQAGYAFSDADLINDVGKGIAGTLYGRSGMRLFRKTGFPPQLQVAALLKANVATGATMVIRSALRKFLTPISERSVQDYWIALLASFSGNYGIGLSEPLMEYRLHISQVSGLHPRPWKLLPHLLSTPPDVWAKELEMFREIREKLYATPELLSKCKPTDLKLLDEKLAHLSKRDLARTSNTWIKFSTVLAEARTGRYEQFSLSWKSALRDLIL